MTIVAFESFDEERGGGHGRELDQLLRQFYEHEVPRSWPAARKATTDKSATILSVRVQSLVALAATLLLTLAGHHLLSSLYTPGIQSPENMRNAGKEAVNRRGQLHDADISSKRSRLVTEPRAALKQR
jgi:hypothetical protein